MPSPTFPNICKFANIRYAAPCVGNLRFAAPIPPNTVNRTINDSQSPIRCFKPTLGKIWQLTTLHSLEIHKTSLHQVQVRQKIACFWMLWFSLRCSIRKNQNEVGLTIGDHTSSLKKTNFSWIAAVLVWIYGGGFCGDCKDHRVAAGLIAQSETNNGEGIIFVALNYRLGMLLSSYQWRCRVDSLC